MKKLFAFGSLVCAASAIALLSAGLGTDEWSVIQLNKNESTDSCIIQRKLGLFWGEDSNIVPCIISPGKQQYNMFATTKIAYNSGVQIATIAFLGLGILSGLLALFISAYNLFSKPYETFAGPIGLMSYFSSGLVFSLVAVIIYTIMFYTDLNDSLPEKTSSDKDITYSKENCETLSSQLGYSFYLMVGAIGPFLIGNIVVFTAGKGLKKKIKSKLCPGKFDEPDPSDTKETFDNMMF
uniref:Uncharacterized protein n=1 Tax=Ciona savignyi TaxID=51511 RepID=H2YSY7_CIOSA